MINANIKFCVWNRMLSGDTTEAAWKKYKDILHKTIEKYFLLISARAIKVSQNIGLL